MMRIMADEMEGTADPAFDTMAPPPAPSALPLELLPAELQLQSGQSQTTAAQTMWQVAQLLPAHPHLNEPAPLLPQQQLRRPNPSPAPPAQLDVAAMSRRNFAPKERKKSPPAARATNKAGKKRGGDPSSSSKACGASARPAKGPKLIYTATASSSSASRPSQSPHSYLLALLRARGYPSSIHKSRDCGYKSPAPTALQLASYGNAVLDAAKKRDVPSLSALLRSGLSRNPCNSFSESVLDMAAKRGDADAFVCQVDAGADVQTADDFGRTPLHHAAWSGATAGFDIAGRILGEDPDMVRVADDRGKAPLEYVREDRWAEWIEFLEKNGNRFWPAPRDGSRGAPQEEREPSAPRPRRLTARVADPEDALTVEVAELVASGRLDPATARALRPGDALPRVQEPAPPAVQGFKFPSMLAANRAGKAVHNMFADGSKSGS